MCFMKVFEDHSDHPHHLGLSAHRYQTARIHHCGPDDHDCHVDHVDHVHDGHVGHDGHDCTAAG